METAKQIMNCFADRLIYRAGVWKPRTSPNTFQGAGDEALKWLQEVKATYGMPVATEVATPEHVAKALEAGIDYLWIGARTSANPLAVQAIADGLQATGYGLQGIFIKNPVNADAKLWLGNIERLEKTGLPVMAVHRGCGHQPCWKMAHEVRLARPDIPMLLDPSHMSGDASKVPALMEKIEELGLDGAMIEVHCDPAHALSDNNQQITPLQLADTLYSIASRLRLVSVFSTTDSQEELNWLRAEIDELDERLWDTIAARMDVSKRIGAWKKAHGVAPLQPERVKVIGERLKVIGERLHLSGAFMQQIWEQIHKESLKQQE
jgi:chorismate mutase